MSDALEANDYTSVTTRAERRRYTAWVRSEYDFDDPEHVQMLLDTFDPFDTDLVPAT